MDGRARVRQRRRRAGRSVLAAMSLALPMALLPGEANAAWCPGSDSTSSYEFDTPGYNVDVWLRLCVFRTADDQHRAFGQLRWIDGGGGLDEFNDFRIQVRLERKNETIAADDSFEYSTEINGFTTSYSYAGDWWVTLDKGETDSLNSANGGWSADGKVTYDINNDNAGNFTWQLQGTPTIN